MKVSELGEFGLINLLAEIISAAGCGQLGPGRPVIGIGDDTAAWKCDQALHLATVDSMVQDVHFSLETITWHELGWKALAINLSDIAAMGGAPEYALIALTLPEDTNVEDIKELYRGIIALSQDSAIAVVGGNVSRSPIVSVTITVFGSSLGGESLHRATARPGDKIAITGYPGTAAAGYEMLRKNLELPAEDSLYLRKAFLQPVPCIKEGQTLLKMGIKTAIDTSDGLLADLQHICEASRVESRLEVDKVPIHPAVMKNFSPLAREMALSGGEDYELLFTGEAKTIDSVKAAMATTVTVIGEIAAGEPGRIKLFDAAGNPVTIEGMGWRHF